MPPNRYYIREDFHTSDVIRHIPTKYLVSIAQGMIAELVIRAHYDRAAAETLQTIRQRLNEMEAKDDAD